MRRAAIFLLVAAVIGALVPARADTGGTRDPRDTEGPQDIIELQHGHGRPMADGQPTVTFTIRSEGRWRNRRLQCSTQSGKCRSLFDIYISTDNRDDIERQIQVFRREGRVRAPVHRFPDERCLSPGTVCSQTSRRIGQADFSRPDRRTFKLRVPLRMLGRDLKRYGWNVRLGYFRDEECEQHSGEAPNKEWGDFVCMDYAPEAPGSFLVHRL